MHMALKSASEYLKLQRVDINQYYTLGLYTYMKTTHVTVTVELVKFARCRVKIPLTPPNKQQHTYPKTRHLQPAAAAPTVLSEITGSKKTGRRAQLNALQTPDNGNFVYLFIYSCATTIKRESEASCTQPLPPDQAVFTRNKKIHRRRTVQLFLGMFPSKTRAIFVFYILVLSTELVGAQMIVPYCPTWW